jgi:RNA polymerase sigma-70 factor, ECF subfamily
MECQLSATTAANFSPLMPANGSYGELKSTDALLDAPDQERGVALNCSIGQPVGQLVINQESAQILPGPGMSTPEPEIDYVRATDEQLTAAAKSSDARALEELIGRHIRSIRKTVYRIVRNYEDAEDVVQDSLLRACRRLSEFRESCKFSTWITKIAINNSLMLLRRRKTRPEVTLVHRDEREQAQWTWDIPDPSLSTEQKYASREQLEYLSRAVEGLPTTSRRAVELFHVHEKSMREAAAMMGISVASAKSRLYRARRILRARLEAHQ